jgi:hypothetical protein
MGEKKHEGLGISNDAHDASVPSVLATRTSSTLSTSRVGTFLFFARLCDAGN